MNMYYALMALTVFALSNNVFGDTNALLNDLLKNNENMVRPVRDESSVVQVKLEIVPRRILFVSEIRQEIKVYYWVRQVWKDEFLTWDPSKYNGTKEIFVSDEVIWHPDIVLYQSNERYTNVEKKRTIPLIVHFDGIVILLTPQIYTTHCKMNLTYYPFDSQVCLLKFGSWAYDGTQVNVSSLVEQAESSSYLHNGEWDLTKVSFQRHVVYYSCCPEPYPDVEYTLQLTRRPWFYIWNLIVPFITITILSSFAFFIPPESGEKVSLAVTSLLSLVVFTQLVLNTIPAASDGTQPIIGMYFVISVIVLSIVVVLSVVSLHAYHKKDSGQHVPPLVRFIVLTCMGTICVRLKCLQIQSPELEPHPSSRRWNPDNNAHLPQNWMKDSGKNLNRTRNISSQKRRNEEDISVVDNDREFPIFSPLSLRKGTTTCNSSRHDEREAGSVLLRIEAMLKNFLQHRTEKKRQDEQDNFLETRSREWIQVSRVFDRFLLIVFTSLFCILPIIISLKCSSML